jgi:hypothetical protein
MNLRILPNFVGETKTLTVATAYELVNYHGDTVHPRPGQHELRVLVAETLCRLPQTGLFQSGDSSSRWPGRTSEKGTTMTDNLQQHLATTPPGPINDTETLARLLADAWGEFHGDDGGIIPAKHFRRIENVTWNPPLLSFTIERHGGTVLGSTRATLQEWAVDVDKKTVTCVEARRRQLGPMAARLDISPIAEEIVAQVVNGQQDHRLKWYADDRVRILVSHVLPNGSAVKQTLAARRRRLRAEVRRRLADYGWQERGVNVYER